MVVQKEKIMLRGYVKENPEGNPLRESEKQI